MPEDREVMARFVLVMSVNRIMKRFGTRAKQVRFDREEVAVVVVDARLAVIVGHGNGTSIGKTSPEALASLLRGGDLLRGVEVAILASCWANAPSVGARLATLLGMEVWAPVTPVAVTEDGIVRAAMLYPPGKFAPLKDFALFWHSYRPG